VTYNVVALTEELPQARSMIRAFKSAHPDLTIRGASRAAVVRLRDEEGRPFVAVETPQIVEAPADVARILGIEVAERITHNTWWVDIRAAADNPRAAEAAHRFAETLVEYHGGFVWPGKPHRDWALDLPSGAAEHPSALVETAKARILAVDSPVVTLSAAVADALAASTRDSRVLQVLTPGDSRITHALRGVLAAAGCRGGAEGPDGRHYDGLTGMPLHWDETDGFRARQDGAPPALARSQGSPGLAIDMHVLHDASHELRLGEDLERASELLCGGIPTVWGTNEPALSAWDTNQLTDYCRGRAPRPTQTVYGGDSFSGTLRISRVTEGVKESTSLIAGDDSKFGAIPELLSELSDTFQTLNVRRVPGAGDTHYRPVLSGAAVPIGLAIGPGPVSEIGLAHALAAPVTPEVIGPRWSPTLWFPMGEGTPKELWQQSRKLMEHLDRN
jgi:hypothetical protein